MAVLGLALLVGTTPARALTAPMEAWVVFEVLDVETWVPIPLVEDVNGIGWAIDWACTALCAPGGFELSDTNLMLDPDPVISFGTTVTDHGGASTFGFVFSQAIVPTAAPGLARSSFSGSTTNGGGLPGQVTVTPAAPPVGISQDGADQGPTPDEVMVYSLSTNGGVSWINAGLDLGPAFSSNPGLISDSFGSYNEGFIPGPAGSGTYDAMRADVNFTLSGGSDVFTFNGDIEIIPEPASGGLVGLGLAALAIARRRARG